MQDNGILKLSLGLTSALVLAVLLLFVLFYTKILGKNKLEDVERTEKKQKGDSTEAEDLITFHGGEDLEIADILEAPGEVIGKSGHGTLYKALLPKNNTMKLLRFLSPLSTSKSADLGQIIGFLGSIRNPNLVPLLGVYAGLRGEKLLVHPFYSHGNLSQFIRVGNAETHRWAIIYKISLGIANGLDHLHTAYEKPIIHGNLKSKNILLGRNYDPFVSDFSLHLLLNPNSGQELLEALAVDGYKAPELIKIRDGNEETDVYSYGIVLLELLTGKEPIIEKSSPDREIDLPTLMRNSILENGIMDLCHPDVFTRNKSIEENVVSEDQILKFFQLAMACCSASPSLRPSMKQVIWTLEEIGKQSTCSG